MSKDLKTKFPEQRLWGIEPRSEMPDRVVYVYEALKKLNLPKDFKMLDLAAGHGVVSNGIKRLFPECSCVMVDIVRYPEWCNLNRNIKTFIEPLQTFIKRPGEYDVVMMLNSFRYIVGGKNRSQARRDILAWLPKHAKYFITSGGRPEHLPYKQGEINGLDYANVPLELYKLRERL